MEKILFSELQRFLKSLGEESASQELCSSWLTAFEGMSLFNCKFLFCKTQSPCGLELNCWGQLGVWALCHQLTSFSAVVYGAFILTSE